MNRAEKTKRTYWDAGHKLFHLYTKWVVSFVFVVSFPILIVAYNMDLNRVEMHYPMILLFGMFVVAISPQLLVELLTSE